MMRTEVKQYRYSSFLNLSISRHHLAERYSLNIKNHNNVKFNTRTLGKQCIHIFTCIECNNMF